MDNVDKSWMHLLRWTDEYIRGVNDFLDKAFERASQGKEILCPCTKCINRHWHYRNVVEDHLVVNGFVDGYTEWVFHGEGFSSSLDFDRLDQDTSGILTTICSHSFHCSSISKWTDSSCPELLDRC